MGQVLAVLQKLTGGGSRPVPMGFEGRVMGTYYRVTVVRRPGQLSEDAVHAAAHGELGLVEALMSAYRPESDVGRFNAAAAGKWIAISPEALRCVQLAIEVGRLTGGAYDITAGPLANLWGFGPGGPRTVPPTRGEIEAARACVGLHLLEVRHDPPGVRKLRPGVALDLASVAKGFAVDMAAETLERLGVRDYCVDAGGEVRTRGRSALGQPWRVAIEAPDPQQTGDTSGSLSPAVETTISISSQAAATSGDYRIYLEHEGKRLSHILDPRTGRPVTNGVASVTVVDPSCARADTWATALMVLGPEAGLALAERQSLAAMFILRTPGGLERRTTGRFDKLLR